MDVINFLTSINKLSLLAFFFTLGILIYEIVLFKKEASQKTKPKIPNFQENINPQLNTAQAINQEKVNRVTRPNNLILIISTILVILFGGATFLGFSKISKNSQTPVATPTPMIDFVTSKGIKIFDKEFQAIPENQMGDISAGREIIIGVEVIPTVDVDRARIRVNKSSWESSDITLNYSDKLKVYYIKYTVASDESKLKIEAQLHSPIDGWLGD